MSTTLLQPMPMATLPTYTEVKGEKPFDWHAFLAKQSHTEDEWHLAVNLAGAWVTCACGNQCDAIEREPNGEPVDYLLAHYGHDFAFWILRRDYNEAQRVLALIEGRVVVVLRVQGLLAKAQAYNAQAKECTNCAGLGCASCHGGANGKGLAHA